MAFNSTVGNKWGGARVAEKARKAKKCGDQIGIAARHGAEKVRVAREAKKPGPSQVPGFSMLVGVAGFELATPCTPCKCATRLRYTPKPTII
jgi:hypothetical protein